jgi:hypothetical protein
MIVVICPTTQAKMTATDWHDGQFAHGGDAVKMFSASRQEDRHARACGHPVRCGFSVDHERLGVLDHPPSRVMTEGSISTPSFRGAAQPRARNP